MEKPQRFKRHKRISHAAYQLLARHGYGGTSMLRIAKAAKASNETLYRWYGHKDALFQAMVEDNAAETRRLILQAIETGDDPRATLDKIAPAFLGMLLGKRAILLNRAAAADPTGKLGAAISAGGRQQIRPLLKQLLAPMCANGQFSPDEATDVFVSLLVGDLQIKRIIHDCSAPSQKQIADRCARSLRLFYQLIEGSA